MQRDQAYRLQHAPEFAGVPVYAMLNEVVDDEPEQFSVDTGISEVSTPDTHTSHEMLFLHRQESSKFLLSFFLLWWFWRHGGGTGLGGGFPRALR